MGSFGRFFVVSAPSGAGKSVLKDRLLALCPEIVYSVSYSTRKPRPGEMDGRDYNFIEPAVFQQMVQEHRFLEWAEVFGRCYGTGRDWVMTRLSQGLNVLADLDVIGAGNIKKAWPEAVLIFVVPPTMDDLIRRLRNRGTESDEEIVLRLDRAAAEISRRRLYDYLLVNDDLERAVHELAGIIEGKISGRPMIEQEDFWPRFFTGHPDLDWTSSLSGIPEL